MGRGHRVKIPAQIFSSPWTVVTYKRKSVKHSPTPDVLDKFKVFIEKAIREKRKVQCNVNTACEEDGKVKRWWTELLTPGGWLENTHMEEYLFVLRRRVVEEGLSDVIVLTDFFSGHCESNCKDRIYPEVQNQLLKVNDGTYGAEYMKPW
ncbi:unnamed protein product, partial [Cuscuta epithymum]